MRSSLSLENQLKLSSDGCSCGVFSDLLYGFGAFRVEPGDFQQTGQNEGLEIFESVFPGRPITATAFYSWYLPKGRSYKNIHWKFVFRDCLDHRLCWDFLNGNWLFFFPTNLKCNFNEKQKHSKLSELMSTSNNCFAVQGEKKIMRKNEAGCGGP